MGCSKENKKQLKIEYGNLAQFVDNVDSLPHLIGALLNKSKWS
jgi:hypothetical protein